MERTTSEIKLSLIIKLPQKFSKGFDRCKDRLFVQPKRIKFSRIVFDRIEIIYNKVDAIGVSESSILVQGKSNFVYKVLEDNSVEKIEVSVGKRSYGKIMVLEGLNINDKIIKEGISKVRNKMKVKIPPPYRLSKVFAS